MKKLILLFLIFSNTAISQSALINNTNVRWIYEEPVSVSDFCQISYNGKYSVVEWSYTNHRVSLFKTETPSQVLNFPVSSETIFPYTAISDTGGIVGVGGHHNIYLYNNLVGPPLLNFDLTQLPDTGKAAPMDVTSRGDFFVCSVSTPDTSTIFGFSVGSSVPLWTQKIASNVPSSGAVIEGLRMSGNDSLFIINTFTDFLVMRTYTGQIIFRGLLNQSSPGLGSQEIQGINGDGSIIATVNITGLLTVRQWNGSTYNILWTNQEPQIQGLSIFSSVDVTYDGEYIAAGTLNFLPSNNYDGKVRVFRRSGNGTPLWTYEGIRDMVTSVSFSRSGNILAASSWGNLDVQNPTADLYIFKTFLGSTPIFKVFTPGSFFYCSTSSDGRTIITSGKAVHARESGFGGFVYNIDVDTTDVPLSVTPINSNSASDYKLYQNYPNPFNPVTVIRFELPNQAGGGLQTNLAIYNSLGERVTTLINEQLQSGIYEVPFNARLAKQGEDLSSGIYFYKLETEIFSESKRMILIK